MSARRRDPYKAVPKPPLERVVVTIDPAVLKEFDEVAANAGFTSRAAAIRELVSRVAVAGSFAPSLEASPTIRLAAHLEKLGNAK